MQLTATPTPATTPVSAAYGSDASYYGFVRREIEPLLPASYERVLEVGCGSGNMLHWLRARRPAAATIGHWRGSSRSAPCQ